MSTNRVELTVEPRQPGKHFSRRLRNDRKVPAIIYGSVKNKCVLVEEGLINKFKTRAFENALFNLKSTDPDLNNVVVLMKSLQVHPLTRRPEHVDLFALDLKKAVRVSVEVRCEGKPVGIAEGGLLNVVNRQIEIECLPTEIPEFFSIDVSHLGIGESVHISDLKIAESIKLISSPDLTVAVVNMAEEENLTPTAAATPEAAGAAAPAAAKAGDAKAAAGGAKAPDAKAPAAKAPAAKK